MVPLTAQQIVQTDPDKRRMWEAVLTDTLERRPNKKADYVLLRSEQVQVLWYNAAAFLCSYYSL